jgi:hypothetical protein
VGVDGGGDGVRQRVKGGEGGGGKSAAADTDNGQSGTAAHAPPKAKRPRRPIHWFGAMPSPALKTAEKSFR